MGSKYRHNHRHRCRPRHDDRYGIMIQHKYTPNVYSPPIRTSNELIIKQDQLSIVVLLPIPPSLFYVSCLLKYRRLTQKRRTQI